MAEFFLELFSEEIPARMQGAAAASLGKIVEQALAPLRPRNIIPHYGPRRIAVAAEIAAQTEATATELRGPKRSAPPQALEGFLRKNQAERNELIEAGDHFLLRRTLAARPAADLIITDLAKALAEFPWPKSMRWGQGAGFTWVRPLRRIVCLLDGDTIPLILGPITASNLTEGHRFLAPGTFKVTGATQWRTELAHRRVIADAADRRAMIADGLAREAASRGLSIVPDHALLDEVTGLVEYPVPLIGRIEQRFMALPPEVRELSMKVNQRYFATRDSSGNPAPYFAFIANIEARDDGAAIIAGNERVLRARLADAEHFWAQDRQHRLDEYLPKLQSVIFHAKIGTQFDRAKRIEASAREIAGYLGGTPQDTERAAIAGLLCKADLVTGMVGEFPELQGIMGGYYAEDAQIGAAIRSHYQPKGPGDALPEGIVPCAVALADKIDTLREFFKINEVPTGSGDPYALRRAALGVIRIVLENRFPENLQKFLHGTKELADFILDRLKVKLKNDGERFDVVNAVFARNPTLDIVDLTSRARALSQFLDTQDGTNLLTGYRRAANILQIEDAKDGPHDTDFNATDHMDPSERQFGDALNAARTVVSPAVLRGDFAVALAGLAQLRRPIDEFFESVMINVDDQVRRTTRLSLLFRLRGQMHEVADFSKLEG